MPDPMPVPTTPRTYSSSPTLSAVFPSLAAAQAKTWESWVILAFSLSFTFHIQRISKSCWLKLQNLPMTGHCYTSDYHSIARLLIQATTISYPAGCNSQLTYSACFRPWVPQPLPSLYSTDLLKIKVLITSPSKECIYSTYLLVIFSYASQPSPPSSSALLKQG